MYLNSISYFRGISIIFIVFGHCLGLANFEFTSIIGNTLYNLTQGGTFFFVFISGFLFHHIFYSKFEYKRFLKNKIKYVLFPYIILSTIPNLYFFIKFIIGCILTHSPVINQYGKMLQFSLFEHFFTGVGLSFIGYWYIPFIMIIFGMSNFFVRFIKFSLRIQFLIIFFLSIGSIYIHRGTYIDCGVSILQNVFFFIPIYLLGILASQNKEFIYFKLNGKEFYLLVIVITLALLQAYIGKNGGYHKEPFVYGGVNLMFFQKIFFCLFFMVFLNRYQNYQFKYLEMIAVNSFGIFFIHGILILFFELIKAKFLVLFIPNSFLIYCLVALTIFLLSILTTLLVKKISPKYSRYIIGS